MKKQSVPEKRLHRKNQTEEAKRQKKTAEDIAEHKTAEDELELKTRLNQILLDAFPCVALLLRPKTREIVASNRAAVQVGAVPGTQCFSTWGHRKTPCPWCLAPKLWEKGEAQHLEVEANGVFWDAYWTPVSQDLYMHYAFDITERKRMLQQLVDSEEMFRTISNAATDAIILIDGQGKISFWNPPAERIFGYSKEEVIGKAVHELFPPRLSSIKRHAVDLAFKKFYDTGKCDIAGQAVELIAKKKDGSEFPLELSISSMNLKGKWHALALVRDITEQKLIRKQIEEYSQGLELTVEARTQELMEANQRLLKAERFSAIGELAGMIGHDLRNPLTGIKNAAYYLKRKQGCLDEAKGTEMLKIIDSSVEHANSIINDLLEYSREIHLELEESCPKSLLDYVLLMVKIPSHIKVLDRTLNQPTIWIDTNKIERVFINLIKNSIDAMPDKGTLEIRSRQVGDNVEFVFADTGTGMTEETLSKIFMPLFTTKAQGMGFGLAICKRIVEAHKGRITVDSSVGRGTNFTVILPVEQKLKAGR